MIEIWRSSELGYLRRELVGEEVCKFAPTRLDGHVTSIDDRAALSEAVLPSSRCLLWLE